MVQGSLARLNGVQEAVSSTLATRTKDGCQKQQKPSPHGFGFFVVYIYE